VKKGNAVALISRIKEKANKFIIHELEEHGIEGIVPSHGEILVILFQGGQYSMKELAEKIGRTKPTVTVLVDKLVDFGYVVRETCAADNRVTYIGLTEKGRSLKPVFDEISQKLNSLVYGDMLPEEAAHLEKILSDMNRRFDE